MYAAYDRGAVRQVLSFFRTVPRAQHIPFSDMLPWLTPGSHGEFESKNLQRILYWGYSHGFAGFQFWSFKAWDGADFIAHARAISRVSR